MKKKNVIKEKTLMFSRKILTLYYDLYRKKQFVLGDQVLRSGTSIGANVEEAIGANSKKDFLYKMKIAYKEARETRYWLRVLNSAYDVPKDLLNNIYEILRILSSIIVSTKKQYHSEK